LDGQVVAGSRLLVTLQGHVPETHGQVVQVPTELPEGLGPLAPGPGRLGEVYWIVLCRDRHRRVGYGAMLAFELTDFYGTLPD
jgi:hypothetical protein